MEYLSLCTLVTSSVGSSSTFNTYDVRLVNGHSASGRVEIWANSQWNTVCDDYWGLHDATVVCRQLGYSSGASSAPGRAAYGRGRGSIILDNVECSGSESSLLSCQHNPLFSHNCVHSEDASARCKCYLSMLLSTLSVCCLVKYFCESCATANVM